jgi:hypothetical protein
MMVLALALARDSALVVHAPGSADIVPVLTWWR